MEGTCLLNVVEVRFHALDSDVLVALDALGLQHLREGTLALLADQSILYKFMDYSQQS